MRWVCPFHLSPAVGLHLSPAVGLRHLLSVAHLQVRQRRQSSGSVISRAESRDITTTGLFAELGDPVPLLPARVLSGDVDLDPITISSRSDLTLITHHETATLILTAGPDPAHPAPGSTPATDNLRVTAIRPLLPPACILEELPAPLEAKQLVLKTRCEISALLQGATDKLLVLAGPCTTHDPKAALEYAARLVAASKQFADELVIVMQVLLAPTRGAY